MHLPIIGTTFKSLFRRSSGQAMDTRTRRSATRSHKNNTCSHRVETLVLTTPMDIERAMLAVTLPKRVDIQANLLSHSKGSTVEKLLKRVGCLELCIQGKSAAAPRRVFEHEVVAAISHVKQHKLQKLVLRNLDLQRMATPDGQQPDARSLLKNRLQKLLRLEELHVQSCRLEVALEDVLRGTELLPRLREVTINLADTVENKQHRNLMVETCSSLLMRPQITSLAISEYPEDEDFWKLIGASKTLTHLSFGHRYDLPAHQQYWKFLQQNTSIEQLELKVKKGTSLTPLMELLKKKTTIVSLLIHLEEDPTAVSQRLIELLEYQNLILQKVHLLCHNIYGYKMRFPCPRMDFLTELNRQGRDHLLGVHTSSRDSFVQPQDSEWIDAMAANPYNVSSTYYWLRSNPNLFSMHC